MEVLLKGGAKETEHLSSITAPHYMHACRQVELKIKSLANETAKISSVIIPEMAECALRDKNSKGLAGRCERIFTTTANQVADLTKNAGCDQTHPWKGER